MTKTIPTDSTPKLTEPPAPADATTQEAIKQSFWLLKEGTAPKLGARAEGGISYHVLADNDRQNLFVAITGNQSGGYFSREQVPFDKIEACLDTSPSAKPFPSKTFKEAFTGRSSNNAGFLVAVLRSEGLLAAAPEAETQHVRCGDWSAWKKTVLAEVGVLIPPTVANGGKKQDEGEPEPDHKEHKKTLSIPKKKSH
jgi:hypothetical protein